MPNRQPRGTEAISRVTEIHAVETLILSWILRGSVKVKTPVRTRRPRAQKAGRHNLLTSPRARACLGVSCSLQAGSPPVGARYFYTRRPSRLGPWRRPGGLSASAGAGTLPCLSCLTPPLLRTSELVGGSARTGSGGGGSVFLTSLAGDFDVGGLF